MLDRTLTPELRRALEQLPAHRRRALTELRFRRGGQARCVFPWGEELLPGDGRPIPVTDKLLRELLDRATGFSPYALRLEESGLYLPLEDGCRMGLCGEAAMKSGRLEGLRQVSSVAIRVAREHRGIAEQAAARLTERGRVQSALIVSPPGRGKTTFLRDLIRGISERGYRVSVADERRELAAASDGVPTLDLGPCTDVLSGCPKAQALPLLLRGMNPQALAVDELSGPAELEMAREAAGCGVALLATAHGSGPEALLQRPGWRELRDCFDWCVTLYEFGKYHMERLGRYAEDHGSLYGGGGVAAGGGGGAAGDAAAAGPAAAASPGAGADAGGNGAAHASGGGAV